MEQLQNLSVHYSGVTTLYDELSINANQYSLSREFDYDYEYLLPLTNNEWYKVLYDASSASEVTSNILTLRRYGNNILL